MNFKGKILIAKERARVTGIFTTKDHKSHDRWTGMNKDIPAGTLVLCIQHYTDQGTHFSHQVYIIHGELTYEAHPSLFAVVEPSDKLLGKSICFTGTLTHTREYYKALVELHGGTAAPGVTKSLSYLVMANPKSDSTKATKARAYGTKCISEEALMELIK